MTQKLEPMLIVNSITTPDGTVLTSQHRHDYVTHTDENGEHYMTDGGTSYIRRSLNKIPATVNDVYDTDDFEIIRAKFERGGRGKNGTEPLTYVALKDMSCNWLQATIEYISGSTSMPSMFVNRNSPHYNPILALYDREQQYRAEKDIHIEE